MRIIIWIACLTLAEMCSAQVQVSEEPRHHKVFDNGWVRVLDVHIPPGDTSLWHKHSTPSVFLILSNTKTGSEAKIEPQRPPLTDGRIWFEGFYDIGEAFGPFDLTMLEIGAYGKYWPDIHMGPGHATNAHLALNGNIMMPIHWGTFNLAPHAWYEPVERLLQLAEEKNIHLFIPRPGQPTEVVSDYNSEWWREFLS